MKTVDVDTLEARSSLKDLRSDIVKAAQLAMKDAIGEAERSARWTDQFEDVSGRLRQNIHGFMLQEGGDDAVAAQLVSLAPYTVFVENGQRPHIIRPRNAKALRFVVNGRVVFARMVRHPGTRPRPFMQEARDMGEKVLDYGLELRVDEAVAKSEK